MKRILICEDETSIRDFVIINLKRAGYEAVAVASGEEAMLAFDEYKGEFSIALLDVMLPGIDGFEVCKRLREKSDTMGIIMLTAKAQEMDKISGLMIGADDYMTKPFSPAELTARVDAIYRRVTMSTDNRSVENCITSGKYVLNTNTRIVTIGDNKTVELTHIESNILEFLMRNTGMAVTREKILKNIWGNDYVGDNKIVDVNIRRLRNKIEEDPSNPMHINTVWGTGYKWTK
jgi:DNA-binding response OmpR family regulator